MEGLTGSTGSMNLLPASWPTYDVPDAWETYKGLNGWKDPWDRSAADYGIWQAIVWIREGRCKHENHAAYITCTMKRFVWEDRAFRKGHSSLHLGLEHGLNVAGEDGTDRVIQVDLSKLNERSRTICLRLMAGCTCMEIAVEMGLSSARISQILNRIRETIKINEENIS